MIKKILVSIMCLGVLEMVSCSGGKSYQQVNDTYADSSKAITDDARVLEGDYFESCFELLSFEDIDGGVSLYVVKDKETGNEYIITTGSRGTIAIIERK